MEIAKLPARRRSALGRNALNKLRAEGQVPAVIYGDGKDSTPLSLDLEQIDAMLRTHHRVFRLDLGDNTVEEAFLQDVAMDPLEDVLVHVDFKRVRLDQVMRVGVSVEFSGHPVGLSKGGKFEHDLTEVMVECLPADLPDSIEVDVKHLDLHMAVTAKELKLPANVKLITPPDAYVCHVKLAKEETPAEAATPAEGEAAAAAQPELIRKPKGEEGAEGAAAAPAGKAAGGEKKPAGDKK